MDSTTGDSGSSSSKARREDEEFQEFLKMLQAQFKGRRCYLGLYDLHPRSSASSGLYRTVSAGYLYKYAAV